MNGMKKCINCANTFVDDGGDKRCVFSEEIVQQDAQAPKVCIERNDFQLIDTKTKSLFE